MIKNCFNRKKSNRIAKWECEILAKNALSLLPSSFLYGWRAPSTGNGANPSEKLSTFISPFLC